MKFQGYRSNRNCGKWGHKWTDCWKGGGGAHGKSNDKSKDMHGKNQSKGKNANSMDTGENWGRASAAGSASASYADGGRNLSGLCSLGKQPQRPAQAPEGAVGTDRDDHGDSGSQVSVCPETVCEVFGFAAPASSSSSPRTAVQAHKTKAREGWRWPPRWARW